MNGEGTAGRSRIVTFGIGAVLVLGVLRFTILAPDGEPAGDRGLAPAGATEDTESVAVVTVAPIEPSRDPFVPVNGG